MFNCKFNHFICIYINFFTREAFWCRCKTFTCISCIRIILWWSRYTILICNLSTTSNIECYFCNYRRNCIIYEFYSSNRCITNIIVEIYSFCNSILPSLSIIRSCWDFKIRTVIILCNVQLIISYIHIIVYKRETCIIWTSITAIQLRTSRRLKTNSYIFCNICNSYCDDIWILVISGTFTANIIFSIFMWNTRCRCNRESWICFIIYKW